VQSPRRADPGDEGGVPDKNKNPDPLADASRFRDAERVGLLQAPGWVSRIRAELANRWQAGDSSAATDPIVNVTIGRVEVRAMQAENPGKSERPKKPTGVMSLDDYLKQRDNKGGRYG
jgi:hypothetical protein